jgi:beta-lactamase class D
LGYARRWSAVGIAAGLLLAAAGCSSTPSADASNGPPPDATTVASSFLNAVAAGDLSTAAGATNSPDDALAALNKVHGALKPVSLGATMGKVTVTGRTATANYTLSWDFGQARVWSDPSSLALTEDGGGNWRVTWSPSILSPSLGAGQSLMLGTGSTQQLSNVRSSDGTPLPGTSGASGSTTDSALLSIIHAVGNQQATSGDGLSVDVQQADGTAGSQLFSSSSTTQSAAAPVTTTLDLKIQAAAETALASVPQQAMAVVIRPSTGGILAVAENSAASTSGDQPLVGLYPPGSTFKIVTASAAFDKGVLTPQQPVACPGTTSIEGRVISNEGKFDLGTTSVTNAFAQSCNTTFSQVAAGLSATDLPTTAKQFGLGVDYTIPDVTTNTGDIRSDSDQLARAEDGFGQGTDQVSVFGMALVAATAERGRTPTPSLVAGQTTQSDTAPTQIPAGTLASLKVLMRAVVTSGTGKAVANVSPPVYGKTGTAQFGDGTQSHGWFVGYQGDLAFAFLLLDAGSSAPAVTVADSFFKAMG